MRKIFLMVLFAGGFAGAFGQLTITASDCRSLIGTTDSTWTSSSSDTTGLKAIIANSGENRTWDISKRVYQSPGGSVVRYAVYPDGAPFPNDPGFASCNVVESIGDTSATSTWSYLALSDTGFYSEGAVTSLVTDGARSYLKSVFTPLYASYKFPMTYNSNWSGTYDAVSSYSTGQSYTSSTSYSNIVDAWGTITTPEGVFPCLRLRLESTSSSGGIAGPTVVYYFFSGKTGHMRSFPLMRMADQRRCYTSERRPSLK